MIDVQGLTFSYPNSEVKTVKDISFSIQKGEIFGFLGPSGAGKSTTQKILYKILPYSKGSIKIENQELNNLGKEYFSKVGVGFELPNHYNKLTGLENLKLFASFYHKNKLRNFDDLFEMVNLSEAKDKKVEAYSKGMKMRLNFIRSILHDPDILFFDEPTAGLDPINAFKLKEEIKNLKNSGKTIFITTHNMNTADELCDRVSFIAEGELVTTEEPSILKHTHGRDVVKVELVNGDTQEYAIKDIGSNIDFLEYIKNNEIKSINSMDATLEEVFIKLTGQALKS